MFKKVFRKLWMSKVACVLLHTKKLIKQKYFKIDPITKRPYHMYKCDVCGRKYLANNKFDWYRKKVKKKKRKK